jgi:hypothetical protein
VLLHRRNTAIEMNVLSLALLERITRAPVMQHAGPVNDRHLRRRSMTNCYNLWRGGRASADHGVKERVVDEGAAVALINKRERLGNLQVGSRNAVEMLHKHPSGNAV